MLVYIQPIFAPNEKLLNKNIASIQSLVQYLQIYPYNVKIITGGWCANEEYWHLIENELCKFESNIMITMKRFDANYGKAHVVNTLYNQHVAKLPIDYFFTCDSDMIFDITCPNMFARLLALASDIEASYNVLIGMLALQQHKECCHIVTDDWTSAKFLDCTILEPPTTYGLAGGAILVNKKAWEKINGYRVLNVYGGNDGWYLNDCGANNFWYGLVDNIYMDHPFEDDAKYALWKRNQILSLGDRIDITELKKRANDSESIWE